MIYLSQLARLTPAAVQKRPVFITGVSAFIDKDSIGEFKFVKAMARSQRSTKRYLINVRLYAAKGAKVPRRGKMKPQNRAWVHCNCGYFRYNVEVALAARGSSNVLSSTGAYPKIRNPRMKPHLCKHLFAAIPKIVSTKPKVRKTEQLDDLDLDQLVKLLDPFIPKK